MTELTPQELLTSKILFDPQPYIQLLMKALEDTLDARDAAVKLLGEVGAPISYWFVTNMGQCLYCNANETPAGILHNPDCLVIRISALLSKEATE